jgi:hypothetical protein
MPVHVTRLCGEEWQEWANQLLSRRYGPTEYQKIPDNQKGDAGLEGYSRCGHAYQCYGCEEPLSTKARYENQRDKLTEDVGKFIDNKAKIRLLLGVVKISRWVLFVPHFDHKDLVSHGNKKADEVIEAKLAYVTTDFQVAICSEDQFQVERDALLNARDEALRITTEDATQAHIDEWAQQNDALVSKLDHKLSKLRTLSTDDRTSRFRQMVFRWYIEGKELLEALRNYPQSYEKVIRAKRHRERNLELAVATHNGPAAELLGKAVNELIQEYRAEARELARISAEVLAQEAIADWLIRCPLDFPG